MLTSRPAGAPSASWPVAHVAAAIILSVVGVTPAYAGGVINMSCVGARLNFNCVAQWATAGDPYVRPVPQALGEAEKARVTARDHKWIARCHPVVEPDGYGVARYHYSAPGCEFGVGTD